MKKLNAADTKMMDAVMYGHPNQQAIDEYEEERRIRTAFQTYFASTPEGMEEGKWLNVATWEWIKAGSPTKIGVGAHPLRRTAFAAFSTQWQRRAETGEAMTMVPPAKPVYKFGVRVG
jgi:hypothetical protein